MIQLARAKIPQALYEVREMVELKTSEYRVDGIVSFYSIFRTPREQHQALFSWFASYLPKGGVMLVTMGAEEWEGTEDDFHGAEMYGSHYGADENIEMVESAGFSVLLNAIDRSANEAHQVIIGRLD